VIFKCRRQLLQTAERCLETLLTFSKASATILTTAGCCCKLWLQNLAGKRCYKTLRTFSKASATIMATAGWKWMSATSGTS
jgi:hypothetical protein